MLLVLLAITGQYIKVEAAENVSTATSEMPTPTSKTIESQVREFFVDIPVMIDIARCESNFRQFNDSGSVLRGGNGGETIGIFQIFESIHTGAATGMGFDLRTVEGNMGYAKYLYQQSGTSPWSSCVPNVILNTEDTAKLARIKLLNQIIILLKQLITLQSQLNLK